MNGKELLDQVPSGIIPAGRTGQASDVAGVFLFLVGKSGAYVNGNVTVIDGGMESMELATPTGL